ncbi:hypothetical protein PHLCEN_2v2504 [Hermanssonia centrifuga]|uniref:Cytochrome P450 n=1 Tax=Hermanssonia centrifuga TaxID=98765 RepID=A0A2R6RLU6_9APHY|nr:hypothetical protein PHLCEN_2v2504 [Hermanssonia centrifuga]
MYSTPSTVVLTLLFLVFLGKILLTLIRARRLRKLMPPGPPGLPLLGNILQIPTKDVWWRFLEWSQEYGPIFSLDFAGKPVVVLNTYETATDLLDRRSGIYADRPDLPMVNNILSGGMNLGFMHYGDLWRKFRRAIHENFNIHAAKAFEPMQTREAISFVSCILDDPHRWELDIKRFAASVVLRITYGWSLYDDSCGLSVEDKDRQVDEINSITHALSHALVQGSYLVNSFPTLLYVPKWLPGAGWKREGLDANKRWTKKFIGLVGDVRAKGAGKSDHCLSANLIENEERFGLDKRETAWLAGVMLAISHNPAVFTDPQEFRPERFLNPDDKDQHELSAEDESSSKVRPNPDKLYAFGFGRRICPGMHLANNSLFIAAATLLWACDITNALDEDGNAIIPDMNALFDTGLGM